MTASNTAATAASQNPASNNPGKAIQIEYVAALKEIDSELLNASSLVYLHKVWIKKCYGSDEEWTDRSIQNAICALSRRSTAVQDAACGAGRKQAEKILRTGGDLDDTIH